MNLKPLLFACFFLFACQVEQGKNSDVFWKLNLLPDPKGQLVNHKYYSLSYIEEYEQAEWVAYELTKEEVLGTIKRKDAFREDKSIYSGSASLLDYKGSGYDRGHLAPAGDMKISRESMSESFFMSNMSPQKPEFNRHIWRLLEEQIRKWALSKEKIYVVTGPIFSVNMKRIGPNQVAVPKHFYKVLLTKNQDSLIGIGFILKNDRGTKPFEKFAVSIDEVERRTGIDFFEALEDSLERTFEGSFDLNLWENEG